MSEILVSEAAPLPNGGVAAAILSAGIGCCAVGICAVCGDAFPALKLWFTFYKPTGPLSGVTTTAILAWLAIWFILDRVWAGKSVSLRNTNIAAFVFLGIGFLLTFPPIGDLLMGK